MRYKLRTPRLRLETSFRDQAGANEEEAADGLYRMVAKVQGRIIPATHLLDLKDEALEECVPRRQRLEGSRPIVGLRERGNLLHRVRCFGEREQGVDIDQPPCSNMATPTFLAPLYRAVDQYLEVLL